MTACEWSIALAVYGGLVEIVAVGLIASDLFKRYKIAKQVEADGKFITVGASLSVAVGGLAEIDVIRSGESTLDERVEGLERRLNAFEQQTSQRLMDIRRDLRNHARDVAREEAELAFSNAKRLLDRLETLVKPLTSDFLDAAIGVGLLVGGVLLQVAASVISTAACG